MAQVTLTVNGRNYEVACGDGEEERIRSLSREIDARVRAMADAVGQVGEARLLLMASLILADEMKELSAGGGGNGTANGTTVNEEKLSERENAVAAEEKRLSEMVVQLDSYAERLETIAERLVQA